MEVQVFESEVRYLGREATPKSNSNQTKNKN